MSSTTPNLGLTKTTAAETIGQNWAASNDSGGNFDIIDTKMGAVGNTSVQAQLDALNSNKATKGKTAFTPVIPRITYSELSDNYAIRSGDIVHARARFKVDSVDTGNTYINGNSFPIFGGTLRYISGIWSDENNDTGGEIHGSSNGNAWFMKNGANYRLDANAGHTIWISATYAIDNS